MTIGLLNDMIAPSSKFGNLALESDDDDNATYVSPPEMNLEKRNAFGEVYTTNVSRLQSRIWLSQVCVIPSLSNININVEVIKYRPKLNSKMEVLTVPKMSFHTGNCSAKLTDYS